MCIHSLKNNAVKIIFKINVNPFFFFFSLLFFSQLFLRPPRSCKSHFYIDYSDKLVSQSVLLDFIPVQEAGDLSTWHA